MSSPQSASTTLPRPAQVKDRALWNAARQMLADHQSSPADGRCVNASCGEGYPCVWARTAARLEAASLAPFHRRMTALLDARSCEVLTPAFSGRATPPGTEQVEPTYERPEGKAAASSGSLVLTVSA